MTTRILPGQPHSVVSLRPEQWPNHEHSCGGALQGQSCAAPFATLLTAKSAGSADDEGARRAARGERTAGPRSSSRRMMPDSAPEAGWVPEDELVAL